MRALAHSGWINFRMRAMLMSVASYQLWLHWREPALHLARQFVDCEPGIHYPQAQMQSGTMGHRKLVLSVRCVPAAVVTLQGESAGAGIGNG